MDLQDNCLIVKAGDTTEAQVEEHVHTGFNGAGQDGTGIRTQAVDAIKPCQVAALGTATAGELRPRRPSAASR